MSDGTVAGSAAFRDDRVKRPSPGIFDRVRSFDGPLTSELVRHPGRFGLGQVPGRFAPDATTTMVCGFCSTGCSLNVHLREGEAVNLTPAFDYPVNRGMACPKGWEALAPLTAPDRALHPMLRTGSRTTGSRTTGSGGGLDRVTWVKAAETFAHRMKFILAKHGPESVAFLSTGQICTEEMALLGAFAKFGMGLVHGDGNTRQCMATAVRAYKESFGFDAPPFTYGDFEESDVIVLSGSNLCIAHPILWQRVLSNRRSPEIVVIDPRRTETAARATRHLAIRPKSDLVLYYGVARILIERGLIDRDFIAARTEDFAGFEEHVRDFTLARTASATGLAEEEIAAFAELIGSGKRVSFWWTMGINQGWEATRTAQAIINLALMTGNIGKPGTGANSITGQCNAMGSRLFSNTTNLLGGRDFKNAEDRRRVAEILAMDVNHIPDRDSLAYDQIIDGVEAGQIKALWIIGTNPAHSWIGRRDFSATLAKLDFLVVQDMYHNTETAQMADLILPAAGWGEKEGTLINSERRIGLVKKVARAPGEALSDFLIFRLLAEAWGCGDLLERWKTPEDVFGIIQALSEGQACDISGIGGYDQLDQEGGIQWPFPKSCSTAPEKERRLFGDGCFFTDTGKARFAWDNPVPATEPTDADYPFVLMTGRGSSAQWHTQTRTGKSAILRRLGPDENLVEIHPVDAARLAISCGDEVSVRSRRGAIAIRAFVTSSVPEGSVFIPMHDESTNRLTLASFDPHSRQPSYKHCAVRIDPVKPG